MEIVMTKLLVTAALSAVIGAGSLVAFTAPASAAIVCNRDGDCWHTTERYRYRPAWGLTVHPDNWTWRDSRRYRWREHDGRGYWRGGVWIGF
jgi:hypothetical protein